jgi:hypothetical protein
MMLIDIEERNTELSRKLRNWFQHDSEALTGVYQELEKSISDFKPAPEAPKNSLHEALYTHIQSLPFQHFVYGFEKAILKSESNISVISIEPDLMSFCKTLGKNIHPLLSKVSSINSFDEFCCSHHLALTAMVQKATGVKTSSEQFKVSIEPARRILHILSNIHLGIKNDTNSISPLDCVAALCTSRYQVGENTPQKIDDRPYWIGCTTQGKNLIRHLGTQRPIEDLYKEDFIPHSVLQILYNRFGFISSALIHSMNYHVAYMKFQIAREKKYAEMLRSNDVDVINRAIGELDFCIEQMLMKFDPSLRLPLPTTTAINKWLEESL